MRIAAFSILLSSFLACNTTEPRPIQPRLSLEVLDVSATEAWLRVSTESDCPCAVSLLRDEVAVYAFELLGADSLLIDRGLSPGTTYSYMAVEVIDSAVARASESIQISTLETTSHAWTFEVQLLGDGASSELFDITIINDTLAYAVGEISVRDSTGKYVDPPYNVARWNGNQWELITALYTYQGQDSYVDLRCVLAFSDTDVWVAGNGILHWNGEEFLEVEIPASIWGSNLINRIWGLSSNDIYIGGENGKLARYRSGIWYPIDTGTSLRINDICGSTDDEIMAVAALRFGTFEREILKIVGSTATPIIDNGITSSLDGIWFRPDRIYYVVGNGIYARFSITDSTEWEAQQPGVTVFYLTGVDGNNFNDIVACGEFGELLHFDGLSWRSYKDQTSFTSGVLYNVRVNGNCMMAVGFESARAVVVHGTR